MTNECLYRSSYKAVKMKIVRMFIAKSVSFWNRLVNLYVLIVSQRYKVVAIVTVQQCLMGPGALNGPAGHFLQARVRPVLTPRHNNYFADPDLVYRGNT